MKFTAIIIIILLISSFFTVMPVRADNHEHNHEHEHGADGCLGGEDEAFEMFHSEYYSMPWRSQRTQEDLWSWIKYLLLINILILWIAIRKVNRKYSDAKK
ncbi:MAG: hypothetical protein ABIH00_00300 [Armatimonadota bacterium]